MANVYFINGGFEEETAVIVVMNRSFLSIQNVYSVTPTEGYKFAYQQLSVNIY